MWWLISEMPRDHGAQGCPATRIAMTFDRAGVDLTIDDHGTPWA
jgi:hypothetical protein